MAMLFYSVLLLAFLLFLFLGTVLIRAAHSLWLRPRWVERQLRQQGLNGNSYRFMVGDTEEMVRAEEEARSKPMEVVSHCILPRADPFISETLQRYGKRCFIWVATTAKVVVWEPKMVSDILQDKMEAGIEKPALNPMARLLGTGIAMLEGDAWAKRRKAITPAFHFDKLKNMVPAFQTSCSMLVKRWEDMTAADESEAEIDVWPEFQTLTGDVISRTAFGSSFEEGKMIFELQKEQAELVVEALRYFYIPGYRFLPTRKNKRRMHIDREIKTKLRAMIDGKLKAMERGEPVGGDLLGLLVHISNSGTGHGYRITINDVVEECKLFYFAGQETTSIWLTWTAVLLANHQEWQQRAREEVLAVCGQTALPTFESLNRLKTLTMILYEALRLYPPAPALPRTATRTTRVGEVEFPAGVDFLLPIAQMHHSTEFWGADAEEFKPERFAEGVANATAGAQGAFFPFGWGPRICLGQNFAMMEAKMAMASLLQRFAFRLSPAYTHAPHTVMTLQPQHGAHLVLSRLGQ